MDTRSRYLQEMGITQWVSRDADIHPAPGIGAAQDLNTDASDLIQNDQRMTDLFTQVETCRRCELHRTRYTAVFGVGPIPANLMIVGEAPSAEDDRQGIPFVGRAGQLLASMLFSIDFKLEDVYIANSLKCRPPDDRDPLVEELAHCNPFLLQQIERIQPKVILALGKVAVQSLLDTNESPAQLRDSGQVREVAGVPVIATYHPAYLLQSPTAKSESWKDLYRARQLLINGSSG
ncbi:uracil-DNA glycosylase family protein [Arenicellales bacterium nBUS_48]